jgi:hypothetical protein
MSIWSLQYWFAPRAVREAKRELKILDNHLSQADRRGDSVYRRNMPLEDKFLSALAAAHKTRDVLCRRFAERKRRLEEKWFWQVTERDVMELNEVWHQVMDCRFGLRMAALWCQADVEWAVEPCAGPAPTPPVATQAVAGGQPVCEVRELSNSGLAPAVETNVIHFDPSRRRK